jgi:hypothetical protein
MRLLQPEAVAKVIVAALRTGRQEIIVAPELGLFDRLITAVLPPAAVDALGRCAAKQTRSLGIRGRDFPRLDGQAAVEDQTQRTARGSNRFFLIPRPSGPARFTPLSLARARPPGVETSAVHTSDPSEMQTRQPQMRDAHAG